MPYHDNRMMMTMVIRMPSPALWLLVFTMAAVLTVQVQTFWVLSNNNNNPPQHRHRLVILEPAPQRSSSSFSSSLGLIPLSKFSSDLPYFFLDPRTRLCINQDGTFRGKNINNDNDDIDNNNNIYELCLVEEKDLPDVSRFIVTCFGADAIRLSQDLTAFERMLMNPATELLNGYSGIIAFAEVLSGLRRRLANRLSKNKMDISPPPIKGLSSWPEKVQQASQSSLLLVLGRKKKRDYYNKVDEDDDNDNKNKSNDDWHVDIIASVELKLEICDAKIPFSMPWLDRVERRLASAAAGLHTKKKKDNNKQVSFLGGKDKKGSHGSGASSGGDLKPYLSSLCVDEQFQGQGIGRALVRCVEEIAAFWGYKRLYLHVDPDNAAAYNLYKSEGYEDVGKRWNPFWAGNAANIAYFSKKITHNKAMVQPILMTSSSNVNSSSSGAGEVEGMEVAVKQPVATTRKREEENIFKKASIKATVMAAAAATAVNSSNTDMV